MDLLYHLVILFKRFSAGSKTFAFATVLLP